MDAFFAAVEQRDFPELKGQPVIVGGDPNSRGVVATCSYEARKFGIHSAMPSSRAYQLCPQARFVRPRFSVYKEASLAIHAIFKQYTDIIEPLSLDEAYLDVSQNDKFKGSATLMAQDIRLNIFKSIQLTASAGISYNKFLAKLASDQNKPDGQFVIESGEAENFLDKLPVGRFHGVGKVTERKMHMLGIKNGSDLKNKSLHWLQKYFGSSAEYYYNITRGIDDRVVSGKRVRKSLGAETTFQQDVSDPHEMLNCLLQLLNEITYRLTTLELFAYTLTIKVKYADFTQVTRSYTGNTIVSPLKISKNLLPILLAKTEIKKRPVRLLGVSFSNLIGCTKHINSGQLSFVF